MPLTVYLGALCLAEEDGRSIQWPSTFSVTTQSALCQGRRNTTILGLAYRTCGAGGVWSSVDASECESAVIQEVRKKVKQKNFTSAWCTGIN